MKMGKKVREYKSGDFIFAKVKGYPAWPARVQKQNGKKYFVYFYGTGETANLPPNMIFDYTENKDKFLNKSVKRKDFNDGVKQIEHDFANNVPLEQVIGALAEAVPAPVDDSMNDNANDTADESAVADTTADEPMDESVSANDGPVDDSDDAGALVIDEGKKGRKSAAKPPATPKAKEPKTPRGRQRKEEVKEEEEEKKEEEVVSRSGRKIKPGKRYIDEQTDENATLPSPAPKKRRGASPSADKDKEPKEKPQDKNIRAYNTVQQSELRELKEPFKSADPEKENILITYLPSGQYCGVKLFQSRPASFKSDASRLQWDKQAASNAITLKRQLEKGQITPQSISAQLVLDLNLTDEQKQTLERDRDLEAKKSRLHFLKTEMKLIELDAKIKTCLSLEKADTDLCLKLIDDILELDLAALMLLKHPTCMETVKRMRVYVGNTPSWEMSESEALTFSKQAHRIRNKADALFITMRDLFNVPEGVSFSELFNERVAQFKAATENLHADKLLEMVHEPIEMSQPSSFSMKAAVDAANAAAANTTNTNANEEEPAEADDAEKKKKPTPAKGKKEKSNSTPLKQPLKRQSRKQQQEEKEKEKEKVEEKSEETDTKKLNDTDKQEETPKENSEENEKQSDADKQAEKETDEADKEVEKVNEKSEKNEKDVKTEESEKADEVNNESNDKEVENKTNDVQEDKDAEINESKKKESNSDKSKDNGKSKDKESKDKGSDKKEEVKNGKDKASKPVDKRKGDKEKSEEKEKVDADEPRAKRSRESKKTEPPPRSPGKRKSRS